MDAGSFLFSLLAFVTAIGILVTIHEFGHFWVARLCGVKVLRFSVGFGKPLWMKKAGIDQTEYVVAAIPLGGYVKMLDEREGEVAQQELPRAFNRQHVSKRFAIVVAGPAFNFLFAIFAYTVMYMSGVNGIKPTDRRDCKSGYCALSRGSGPGPYTFGEWHPDTQLGKSALKHDAECG